MWLSAEALGSDFSTKINSNKNKHFSFSFEYYFIGWIGKRKTLLTNTISLLLLLESRNEDKI